MAYVERYDLPILTLDFEHFRAPPPPDGYIQSTEPAGTTHSQG